MAPPGARSAATEHTGTVSAQRAGLRTRGRTCAGGASRLSPVPIEVTSTKRFTPRRAASSTRFMLPCAPRRRRRAPAVRQVQCIHRHASEVDVRRCPARASMPSAGAQPAPDAGRARQTTKCTSGIRVPSCAHGRARAVRRCRTPRSRRRMRAPGGGDERARGAGAGARLRVGVRVGGRAANGGHHRVHLLDLRERLGHVVGRHGVAAHHDRHHALDLGPAAPRRTRRRDGRNSCAARAGRARCRLPELQRAGGLQLVCDTRVTASKQGAPSL